MKITTPHEVEFANKEWGMRAAVVGDPNRPGYLVVVTPYNKAKQPSFIYRDAKYYKTIRLATNAALDIVGAD